MKVSAIAQSNYPSINRDVLGQRVKAGSLFAILDASAHPDIAGFAAERAARGEAAPLAELDTSDYLTEDAVAYVIKLDERIWRFVEEELWQDDGRLVDWGLFFELAIFVSFNNLRDHWRYWYRVSLENTTPMGNRECIFRFFDPRLTSAFLANATLQEQQQFFGPLAHFLLPQTHGEIEIHSKPQTPEGDNLIVMDPQKDARFAIGSVHLNALEQRRLECRMPTFLSWLETHFEEQFTRWKIVDRPCFIRAGIRQATSYGLYSERAALGWLSLQLLHGTEFIDEQPWALKILNDKRDTIGTEDRGSRLIREGFKRAREERPREEQPREEQPREEQHRPAHE